MGLVASNSDGEEDEGDKYSEEEGSRSTDSDIEPEV